jgi:aquaporin Z
LNARSLVAEALGTGLLVFVAVGTATLSFGFHVAGTSNSAGVVVTALAFGLVLGVLVYCLGPISGCHINPAVTIGFLAAKRITLRDAAGYWAAQLAGGIAGAAGLYAIFHLSSAWHKGVGLGADGFGKSSMIGIAAAGAFIAEVVLTAIFVLVILAITRQTANGAVAGLVIGLTLTLVHLMGIPIDGTSVNPARSIGPALFVGGSALSQLWLFIVAPLVGGVIAALIHGYFYPEPAESPAR